MSTNLSYGNDMLISVQPFDSKTKKLKSSQSSSPSSAIKDLIDNNILKQSGKQRIPNTSYFTDRDYLGICVCMVTVDTIILPHKSWQFSFDLWIKNRSKWYYHTFKMSRDNFKQLHANINFNENNSGQNIYIHIFPSIYP